MTDSELKELYRKACYSKNYEPSDGQFKVWKQTLGFADEPDLARALTLFFQDNTEFPMPSQLKHLIERARRERLQASELPCEHVEYECPSCHAPFSTVVNVGDNRNRICLIVDQENKLRGCRVRLTELSRTPSQKGQKRA